MLGDPAWEGAEPATGFWQVQPNDGFPATQRTEVRMGFNENTVYIGVVAYDTDPDRIIVSDSRRDSTLDDTDAFLVIIDGLLDRQNGFVFGTNAAGLEYDGQVVREGSGGDFGSGGGGFNLNWDGTWAVEAQISDIGWSAEFAIPFKTLRYGADDEQVWGVNFQRNIRRNNEITFWAPLDRNRNLYRVSEAGTVEGLRPPVQRNLKVTPYVLGKAQRGGELSGTETDTEFGFDIKYSITPSLTLDATYNTDFAQVEVDDQQVNLDRFNLFFPEKRPFFLENAGQFSVGNAQEVELFFSRRIGIGDDGEQLPIDGGLRLSGKIGDTTNVGLLYMRSDAVDGIAPQNDFAVARVNQELPNRSAIGAIFVSRDGDGSFITPPQDDENQSYAIDGRWGIGENILLSGWAGRSSTPGLNGDDHAFSLGGTYSSAKYESRLFYTEVGGDFNPEVGFLTRSEYRKADGFILRRIRPDDLWGLLEIRPHVSYRGFWDFDGFQETGFLHLDTHWEFKSGMEIHTGVNFTRDGVKDPFDIVDGVTIQPDTYDHAEGQIVFWTNEAAPLSFNLRTVIGGRFGGDRVSVEPGLVYRIGETFSSELSVNYNDFDLPVPNGDFDVTLASLRLSYSFTPKILLQALVQYNDIDEVLATNLRFSWLRSANSGLFIVYNEIDERYPGAPPRGRELIIKFSHIFDVFN
ncbi:MAG: carbohydrate binding family 9 domain-containing protein [Gammaproteobacteria bacterium]|nr:carbohydrate binding family 9 domain-containing protein [Gammaproteobacteria bacterium]